MEVPYSEVLSPAACGLLLGAFAAGCAEKPRPAGAGEPAEGVPRPRGAEGSDVGVGDVVDYLTGKTPLSVKKRTEEKLDRITREREKQLEEFLDGDETARPSREEKPGPVSTE